MTTHSTVEKPCELCGEPIQQKIRADGRPVGRPKQFCGRCYVKRERDAKRQIREEGYLGDWNWDSAEPCPKTERTQLLARRGVKQPAVVQSILDGITEFAANNNNGIVNRFLLLRGIGAWHRCRVLQGAIKLAESRHDHDSAAIYKAMLKIETNPSRAYNAPPVQPEDVLEVVYERVPDDYIAQEGERIISGDELPEDAETIAYRGDDGKSLV